MPNWAICEYRLVSETSEVKDLYERMKKLQEMKEPLKPNGFGTTWLGNLVEDLGVDFNKVQCRGSWDNLDLDGNVLSFYTETAWYRCTEVEDLIKEKYPTIDISFGIASPFSAIAFIAPNAIASLAVNTAVGISSVSKSSFII